MASVPRPLIGLLIATVAFFAVWTIALKPSSSSSGSGTTGTGAYKSAIDKAHQAVAASQGAGAARIGAVTTAAPAQAAGSATTPSQTGHTTAAQPAAKSAIASAAAKTPRTPLQRQIAVERALRAHKVVAVLFFNPRGADDRAVREELATVPTHGGRVFKLAVPLAELTHFPVITTQVPIYGSPTLVLIDRTRRAGTIVGFSDRFEISQRVDQALAVK